MEVKSKHTLIYYVSFPRTQYGLRTTSLLDILPLYPLMSYFLFLPITFHCPNTIFSILPPPPTPDPLLLSLPQVKSPTLEGLSNDSGRTLTSSDFNLRCLTPDRRVEGLLAFSSHEELDRINQEARYGNRHPELFALYPPADEVRHRESWYS